MRASGKHPTFIVRQAEPLNGGPALPLLRESMITPTELFFVRNHAPVPDLDAAAWRLRVTGMVERELELSLDDLRGFRRAEVTASLQCAGNRRSELIALEPIPGEVGWGAEAVSTAAWGGVPLRAVLEVAGVRPEARHAAFTGLDRVEKGGKRFGLGGSVPIAKALAPEVLLVDEMNGEPLPPAHGFPLRVVVPGYIGARSVKWLGEIRLQAEPSDNHFQARAYRLFPPWVRAETAHEIPGISLGETSLTSVICVPEEGAVLDAGPCWVEGYAVAGGERRVERVDVSADGGESWVLARLEGAEPWAWRFFATEVRLPPGRAELVARAFDSAANTQPESVASVWNFKGYMNNAWHRVRVTARGA